MQARTANGAVYVYRRTESGWALLSAEPLTSVYPASSNGFGSTVALSHDGTTLAVGETKGDGDVTDAGLAHVFSYGSGGWGEPVVLAAGHRGTGDEFGGALALSADGNTLVVGARRENGTAAGINGTANDDAEGAIGAAYVFTRTGGVWNEQAVYMKASNPSTGKLSDDFGTSVAVSGDGRTVAVGALRERSGEPVVCAAGEEMVCVPAQANTDVGGAGAVYLY